jgi:hypothetical protein
LNACDEGSASNEDAGIEVPGQRSGSVLEDFFPAVEAAEAVERALFPVEFEAIAGLVVLLENDGDLLALDAHKITLPDD